MFTFHGHFTRDEKHALTLFSTRPWACKVKSFFKFLFLADKKGLPFRTIYKHMMVEEPRCSHTDLVFLTHASLLPALNTWQRHVSSFQSYGVKHAEYNIKDSRSNISDDSSGLCFIKTSLQLRHCKDVFYVFWNRAQNHGGSESTINPLP